MEFVKSDFDHSVTTYSALDVTHVLMFDLLTTSRQGSAQGLGKVYETPGLTLSLTLMYKVSGYVVL